MPKLSPVCLSTTSKKNPLKQQTHGGWVEWSWKDKVTSSGNYVLPPPAPLMGIDLTPSFFRNIS